MHIRSILLAAPLLLGLAGCLNDNGIEPVTVEGRYSISTVAGQQLPIWANWNGSTGSGRQLRSGTLTLRAPDQAELVLGSRILNEQGVTQETLSDTIRGTYQVTGGQLVLRQMYAGLFGMNEQAVIVSGKRIDGVLHLMRPAYAGYGSTPAEVSFTR